MPPTPASPSFKLLLQSVRLDDTGIAVREAEEIIRSGTVDWDELLERAGRHYIRPQLENLLNKVPSSLIPGYVREKLTDANRENLLRQLRSIGEFFKIKQLFDDENITVVPYKGFWLAEAMYGNIADREAYDIDLFIDVKDLERIKALMLGKGYVNTSLITRLTDEYIVNELCEYNFEKYENEVRIFHFEYHWRSSLNFFRMDVRMNDLRSQVVSGQIQGKELEVFSPAANLLLTVMHHGGKEQFARLKQVLDIAYIIKKEEDIDWQWLIWETQRYGLEKVLFIGIRLANMVTGVKIPPLFEKETSSTSITRMAQRRLRAMARPVSDFFTFRFEMKGWIYHIRSRNGIGLKFHLLWHFIRKVLMPEIIPHNLHHLFYNKKIRRK